MRAIVMLVLFILASFAAAAIGGVATSRSLGTWYRSLKKPRWTPPDWVFAPVWTCLYLLMGIAAWLVWRLAEPGAALLPLALHALQLVLNALWSLLFFGLRRPGWALIGVVLLWAAIAATIVAFSTVSLLAALLLVPYLAWVTFASVLNYAIWRLNPFKA